MAPRVRTVISLNKYAGNGTRFEKAALSCSLSFLLLSYFSSLSLSLFLFFSGLRIDLLPFSRWGRGILEASIFRESLITPLILSNEMIRPNYARHPRFYEIFVRKLFGITSKISF